MYSGKLKNDGEKMKKKDLEPIERSTPSFLRTKKRGWLTRLPILKQRARKKHYPRGFDVEAAQIIPMNLNVGDYESEVIPLKLMDYFIEKAGTILLMSCPCRTTNKCQNHEIELGCVWMGKGAANLDPKNLPGTVKDGRFATKEEAKEHARLALKNGLVPALGKLRGDARAYRVVEFEGREVYSKLDMGYAYPHDTAEYHMEYKWTPGFNDDAAIEDDSEEELKKVKIIQEWITVTKDW